MAPALEAARVIELAMYVLDHQRRRVQTALMQRRGRFLLYLYLSVDSVLP